MLSIGKLSHLVHMEEANVAEDSILDGEPSTIRVTFLSLISLQAFHNGLDFVSVHESLLQDLRSCLVAARARQSLDAQLDTILKAKGGKIFDKAAFTHVIVTLLTTHLLITESDFPDFQGSPAPATTRKSALSGRHHRFAYVTGQRDVCRGFCDKSPFVEECQGK